MDMIWMQHPLLPPDQLIYEPEEARIGHQQSGWQETAPPAPLQLALSDEEDEESSPEPPAADEAAFLTPQRRTSKES